MDKSTQRNDSSPFNRDYAKAPEFIRACEMAGITPSKRQASKFRLRKGAAHKALREAASK